MEKRRAAELLAMTMVIVVLFLQGLRLSRAAWNMRQPQRELTAQALNQRLVFQSALGIDVFGKLVYPLPPPEVDRTIVFLLRGKSIVSDLQFWHQVEGIVPTSSHIRLIGYCDSDDCINDIKAHREAFNFPVIAYGELVASQALINADEDGSSVLLREQWLIPHFLKWRTTDRRPLDIVREAMEK